MGEKSTRRNGVGIIPHLDIVLEIVRTNDRLMALNLVMNKKNDALFLHMHLNMGAKKSKRTSLKGF